MKRALSSFKTFLSNFAVGISLGVTLLANASLAYSAEFDGTYTGSWRGTLSSGATGTGDLTLTAVNGVVTGDTSPISGSTRAISGTLSAFGAITASIPAGSNGCSVTLAGQITTLLSGATAAGTYSLLQSASTAAAFSPPSR